MSIKNSDFPADTAAEVALYDTVVAIDLETTGADAYTDTIIEVGAAVYRDGEVCETFSELIATDRALAPGIVKLTGITQQMLADCRPLDTVLADFLAWLPADVLCIAHNAAFERAFLRVATKDRFKHTVLDTVQLARICYPEIPSHSMDSLREALDLPEEDSHRALGDCLTLLALWRKLQARALEIPLPVVGEINFLIETNRRHPLRDFFRRLESEITSRDFGRAETSFEALFPPLRAASEPPRLESDKDDWQPLDADAVVNYLKADGAMGKVLSTYEERTGQIEMARAVVEAFNDGTHLLVEAGTGIGKSLAYLLPAVLFSRENDVPVMISTNTKNLQAQLFDKDLPLLREVLGFDFKMALIKGRGNYLCLRKLLYVLRQAGVELDNDERMQMLPLLTWAAWTRTGDIAENILTGRPGFWGLWAKLSTKGEDCMGKGCRHYARCFLRKARFKALQADVVVANHALVFAEMNMKSPTLPPYAQVIFDEAHNIEDAATQHLSVEISQPRILYALGRLSRSSRRGKATGLIPSILQQLVSGACSAEDELVEQATRHAEMVGEAVAGVQPPIDEFFAAAETLLKASKNAFSVRFDSERKRESRWEPIVEAKKAMVAALAEAMRAVEYLSENLREMESGQLQYQRDFIRDLDASLQWLREITEDLEFVLEATDEEYVYWIEKASPKQGGGRLWAAPRKVGPLLYDQVYARKRTVVFSSATLTVRDSFEFLKKRIGIDLIPVERLVELNAGTPFDYRKQCLVLVPVFLPEPSERGGNYARDLALLLAEVYRRTQGRGMALFTSYEMLRGVAQTLNHEMTGDGIHILAQGMSGSRENITAVFKRDIHSVLLGTHSFWEGVDVIGEALSCLTIARLPFAVFTDPIVEARCEQVEADGDNAFLGYSLPSSVIRFRQGFGRLIRHKSDRGIVIVADRRMVAKRYGKWFQDSLPCKTVALSDREEFLDTVSEWLGEE